MAPGGQTQPPPSRSGNRLFESSDLMTMSYGSVWGFAFLILVASILDTTVIPRLVAPGEPILSHGQQFGFFSCPLAGMLGAGMGLSTGIALRGRLLTAGVMATAFAVLPTFAAAGLWRSSVARYGHDASDLIVYVPIVCGGAGLLFWAGLLMLLGMTRTAWDVRRQVVSQSAAKSAST